MTRGLRFQPVFATLSTPLWLSKTKIDKPLLLGKAEHKCLAAVSADYCLFFHCELRLKISIDRLPFILIGMKIETVPAFGTYHVDQLPILTMLKSRGRKVLPLRLVETLL
jgi:hypothetical protein